MNLSPIAKAINSLCHELTPPTGAEPPTPRGGFQERRNSLVHSDFSDARWVSVDEVRATFNALEDVRGVVDSFCGLPGLEERLYGGAPGGPSFKLRGWWARIGGMSPVVMPPNVSLKDVQDFYHGTFDVAPMSEQAVRVWFDEADKIDPIKFERIDPYSMRLRPEHDGTPTCRCRDCWILRMLD